MQPVLNTSIDFKGMLAQVGFFLFLVVNESRISYDYIHILWRVYIYVFVQELFVLFYFIFLFF